MQAAADHEIPKFLGPPELSTLVVYVYARYKDFPRARRYSNEAIPVDTSHIENAEGCSSRRCFGVAAKREGDR